MEKLLRLLSSSGKFVVTYYDVDTYNIVVMQDSYGNALYIEIINLEF